MYLLKGYGHLNVNKVSDWRLGSRFSILSQVFIVLFVIALKITMESTLLLSQFPETKQAGVCRCPLTGIWCRR
jgi:hypothetical protein